MHRAVRLAVIAVLGLAAAGCQYLENYNRPIEPAPIEYGPATERQLQRALSRYSALIVAMDPTAIASMYAPDGVWERQSGPLQGREAIRAALAETNGVRVLSNEMIMANMSYLGPAVLQTGDFHQASRLPDGRIINASGRFEATWVRGPEGEWLIRRMVFLPAK